jgi:hypothetical protein
MKPGADDILTRKEGKSAGNAATRFGNPKENDWKRSEHDIGNAIPVTEIER